MSDAGHDHLNQLRTKSFPQKLLGYAKLTGPGWLQAAVTLGGGSLAGALYLGVIAGYSLMWLQPLAMLCGVIMLMALAHVTLGRDQYPFEAVKSTISPTLAWGWLLATVLADVVFCAAQASLGVATLQQNLGLGSVNAYVITSALAVIAFSSSILYSLGSKAAQLLDVILKLLVAMVMVCFATTAGILLFDGQLDIGGILVGFIPTPASLFSAALDLRPMVEATGAASAFWETYIIDEQRSRIIAAFGTAVGINMTFLLPYTLVKRGWGKVHRELSRFDLVIALFVPFTIATSFLVILASSTFHASYDDVLLSDGTPEASMQGGYYKILTARLASDGPLPETQEAQRALADALPLSERQLAAALTNRDAKQLANTLTPMMGETLANGVFGSGILAMALSTMMVLMLMNGFAVSQAVGKPGETKPFIIGASMPAMLAIFAPVAWTGDAKTALLIPAAVIATVFLPIAYFAIILLMNKQGRESGERPSALVNACMIGATGIATSASVWLLTNKGMPGLIGISVLCICTVLGIHGYLKKES